MCRLWYVIAGTTENTKGTSRQSQYDTAGRTVIWNDTVQIRSALEVNIKKTGLPIRTVSLAAPTLVYPTPYREYGNAARHGRNTSTVADFYEITNFSESFVATSWV